jgi:tRNA-modifying protein YgfZ
MNEVRRVDLGSPTVLEFRGPDALRFLNGQLTQDVNRVKGQSISLPSCVTDVKGKIQFRVNLLEAAEASWWVTGLEEWAEALEARLTRYLIADDVEVTSLTGNYHLVHLIGEAPTVPSGVIVRTSKRYGVMGTDWWIPNNQSQEAISKIPTFDPDELVSLRILNGAPAWGSEIREGMLPPEGLLDRSDCSYSKGCYIGQEVLSRMKSAGKVNRRLTRFVVDSEAKLTPGTLENGAGELTSLAPVARGTLRDALGYMKRGASEFSILGTDGKIHPLEAQEI